MKNTTLHKKIFTAFAVMMVGAFTFNIVGCSEEMSEKGMDSSFNKKNVSTKRLLNDEQVKMVGELHNSYLTDVFANYNFQTNDRIIEFQTQFENLDLKDYKIDWNKKDYGNVESELLFLKENLSDDAFLIIKNAVKEMDSFEHFDEYSFYLNSKEMDARTKLEGIELDATLILLSVFENSAKFWLSVDEGGRGIGYDFTEDYNSTYYPETNNGGSIRGTLRRALIADGVSAAIGFIVGAGVIAVSAATAGMATPAIVAFLVGVAAESAISSAAAIGIDIK